MYVVYVRKTPDILANWSYVFRNQTGILSIVVLSFFIITAFLDSIHIKNKFVFKIQIVSSSKNCALKSGAEEFI